MRAQFDLQHKLKAHLLDECARHFGTRDLAEANRRAEVLDEWRVENGKFSVEDINGEGFL